MFIEKRSVVLLHGLFASAFFDLVNGRKSKSIFILEGRPAFAGARHAVPMLKKRKITPTLIADNMAGFLFFKDLVKEVWLAYELIDPQGALCSTGSLILAVLARKHHVPVYLYPAGKRTAMMGKQKDIFYFNGIRTAPQNIRGYVPLLEWVPNKYMMKAYEPARN